MIDRQGVRGCITRGGMSPSTAIGGFGVLGVLLSVAAAAGLPKGTTALVSMNAGGTDGGNSGSTYTSLNAIGRFVAFQSDAADLVGAPPASNGDVFLRDLRTRATTLVSVNRSGTAGGNGSSSEPSVSASGRFVVFYSTATDLTQADNNQASDVFLRDVRSGVTTLVSFNAMGTGGGNEDSFSNRDSISANGRLVVFFSGASDLVPGDDAIQASDVFLRDLRTGSTSLVSVDAVGTGTGNGSSYSGAISGDGRYVAFGSQATNLIVGVPTPQTSVFVRDLKTRTTMLVSVNASGTGGGDGFSGFPSVSAHGRFVAFSSDATDLVAGDGNGDGDVFVRDLKTGTTALVSVNTAGTGSGNGRSGVPSISANGRFVVFQSDASDLVPGDAGGQTDVFLRDLRKRTTTLVSANSAGTAGGNAGADLAAINAGGRYAAFRSSSTDLGPIKTNASIPDVFVRRVR